MTIEQIDFIKSGKRLISILNTHPELLADVSPAREPIQYSSSLGKNGCKVHSPKRDFSGDSIEISLVDLKIDLEKGIEDRDFEIIVPSYFQIISMLGF